MSGMTAEDLLSVTDVLVESLPELAGARIVRPWALAAAGAAASGTIAGVDVTPPGAEPEWERQSRAMAEAIRRLRPLDHGNGALAVVAVVVSATISGASIPVGRAAAIARVRLPGAAPT